MTLAQSCAILKGMEVLAADITEFCVKLLWGAFSFFAQKELLFIGALCGALVCTGLALRLHRTPLRRWHLRLFPPHIWRSPDAKLDAFYYFIIQAISVLMLSPALLYLFQPTSLELLQMLESVFGERLAAHEGSNPIWAMALYSVLVFLALDFAFFISHYLQHKWRWLWCFHKVHHSAEVLVPFTAMRFHPLDMLWNMAWGVGLTLLMSALCQYFFYVGEDAFTLLGNHVFVAISYITTHNLRHSHVWLHYPPRLSNWLLSPVQHQIHHSIKPEHIDTNFGYLFAGWDRLFGTLVNPTRHERIRVGVLNDDGTPYTGHRTLRGLLLSPFKEAREVVFARRGAPKQSIVPLDKCLQKPPLPEGEGV